MAAEPDRIKNDIELTRARLTADVDQLADRTSPTRVMQRGWHRFTDKVHTVSDTVMGKPAQAADSVKRVAGQAGDKISGVASDATDKIGEVASSAADTVREAPRMAAEQTRGNPIAAGLIAFGAGLLAAALIPETEAERRLSRKLADSDLAQQVREPLMESADQVRQDVAGTVKQSASEVVQTAKEAASSTMDEAKETAQRAKEEAARATR